MMMRVRTFTLACLLLLAIGIPVADCGNTTDLIWPLPSKISFDDSAEPSYVDPCAIQYKIKAVPEDYVKQMLNVYLIDVFHCTKTTPGSIELFIIVKNPTEMFAYSTDREKYKITIRSGNTWELSADYYPGFLRGLETFAQLFHEKGDKKGEYVIRGRPILIDDQPDYQWRGLMIDSSRHFLPTSTIKHTIDGLMYSKMNIMHWHIVDEDSFPPEIKSHPELNQYGKVGGTYTQAEIKSIINYAKVRGVRVIPEFDTPAHTQSWGRSPGLQDIILNCNDEYEGQFDPTMDKTYDLVKDVFTEISSLFEDDYVHFGGDQIEEQCFDQRPSIKEWMKNNNMSSYNDLEIYYRMRQKKIWRNITGQKKAIYWANEEINLPVENDDVIQWWGVSKNVHALANRTNQIILSNYDLTYLDLGFGNRYGRHYGNYINWRDMYQFNPQIKDVKVIGGEVCMWSQLSNTNTYDQKVWLRANVLSERLWRTSINPDGNLLNISKRLIAQAKRLRERGLKVQPVTVGLCEKDPSICFH